MGTVSNETPWTEITDRQVNDETTREMLNSIRSVVCGDDRPFFDAPIKVKKIPQPALQDSQEDLQDEEETCPPYRADCPKGSKGSKP